ncbi:hypothetical protein DFH27DRAFT_526341 [Peziza echinospora]|nr:hypothetical protein DFH27DRAFT_526341 [Peziza echinospora]
MRRRKAGQGDKGAIYRARANQMNSNLVLSTTPWEIGYYRGGRRLPLWDLLDREAMIESRGPERRRDGMRKEAWPGKSYRYLGVLGSEAHVSPLRIIIIGGLRYALLIGFVFIDSSIYTDKACIDCPV